MSCDVSYVAAAAAVWVALGRPEPIPFGRIAELLYEDESAIREQVRCEPDRWEEYTAAE